LRTRCAAITLCVLAFIVLLVPAAASAAPGRSAAASGAMLGKINQVRARHGLRPLHQSPSLAGSSGRFASYLMHRGVLAHRSRVSAGGGFKRLGEALALTGGRGYGVGAAVRMWLRSPGHRAVVLTRSMNLVGVGAVRGRFRGTRATVWVLQTGRR
jgi:uncharacterized protein YkwD